MKIEYLIETHLKNLDDELIALLKKSGLKLVYVGIESAVADVLKDINRFTVDQDNQYQVIKKLVDNDIYVKINVFEMETLKMMNAQLNKHLTILLKLPHQLVQYSVFTPYPGTSNLFFL